MNEMKQITPISIMPECPRFATAYVPFQYMCSLFEPEDGLEHGTIFPEMVDDITRELL